MVRELIVFNNTVVIESLLLKNSRSSIKKKLRNCDMVCEVRLQMANQTAIPTALKNSRHTEVQCPCASPVWSGGNGCGCNVYPPSRILLS